MRRLILGSSLVLLFGCSESPTDNEGVVITLLTQTFSPAEITIDRGTDVTWVNANAIEHNITPISHTQWEAKTVTSSGERFSVQMDSPGVYRYECTIHAGMEGEIEVTS